MPLEDAPVGSPGFGRNVAAEERAGKPEKQSVAIAYSKAGEGRHDAEATMLDAIARDCEALHGRMDAWEILEPK